jgi:DNA polymerase-3 subunit beta
MAKKKTKDEVAATAEAAAPAEEAPPPPPEELSFEIQAGEFQSALAMVHRGVPNRTVLPVLSNILIQSEGDNQLRLSGTNLELAINLLITAKVLAPGGITLPARALLDTINTLPKEALVKLKVTAKGMSAEIRAMSRRVKLLGIDAAEYPLTFFTLTPDAITLPGTFLAKAKKIIPATAKDEARPILTVVAMFLGEDGTLRLEGADGFRLHRDILHTDVTGQKRTMMIPWGGVKELCDLFDAEEPILMDMPPGQGRVIFSQGTLQIVATQIEGNFPDLTAVIPKAGAAKLKVTVGRKNLIASIRSTGVFSKASAHTLRMKAVAGDEETPGYLNLKMAGAEVGEFEDRVDATLDGEPMEIAVNCDYLKEGLEQLESDKVTFLLQSPTSPILVIEDDFVLVCMPMHIGR